MIQIYPHCVFKNAQEAFVMLYDRIVEEGYDNGNGTKALYDMGFYIMHPNERTINVDWRNWNETYAKREWQWYMTQDRSVETIKKYAPIWDAMHSGDNIVNSNYGYLWNESDQLELTIAQLRSNKSNRQAWISLFDGKRKREYEYDTPCTLNIGFQIINDALKMSVLMRSNDLWFGFCNDQYCFSKLHENVAEKIGVALGTYYHYASDLHLYEEHLTKRDEFYAKIRNKREHKFE